MHARFGKIAENGEGAVGGLVSRNLGLGEPGTVDVFEEIVARFDGAIHSCDVEAPRAVTLGGDRGGGRRLRVSGECGGGGKREQQKRNGRTYTSQTHQLIFLLGWLDDGT